MRNPKVSIIIPTRRIDEHTEKCVQECLKLDYDNFEVIISVAKKEKDFEDDRVKIIEVGEMTPAIKRNLGMEEAEGDFFAFIDSDAYPDKNWLRNAIKYFEDEKIGLVGGPNLTPSEANFAEKISGHALSNFWVSGLANIRYRRGKKNQIVRELPSCNYICRKSIAPKYEEGFLTAEDSKFCFDVAKKGYKILYGEDVVVYHHRRDTIKKHIKQMFIYGRDIAWLIKEKFSIEHLYFSLLSVFVLSFIVGAIFSIFYPLIRIIFLSFTGLYFLIMLLTSIHENLRITAVTFLISIITHFVYGIGFLYGILIKNPKGKEAE